MKKTMSVCLSLLLILAVRGQDRQKELGLVAEAAASHSRHVEVSGVRLELRGVYVLDGLLWFSLRVSNGSVIDLRAAPMRFSIRDRRVLRRRARQELPLATVVRRETLSVLSDSAVWLYYGLAPRLPDKRQELVMEYGERTGPRRMSLRLRDKDILKAKKLKEDAGDKKAI
jgi:hypothetical protein